MQFDSWKNRELLGHAQSAAFAFGNRISESARNRTQLFSEKCCERHHGELAINVYPLLQWAAAPPGISHNQCDLNPSVNILAYLESSTYLVLYFWRGPIADILRFRATSLRRAVHPQLLHHPETGEDIPNKVGNRVVRCGLLVKNRDGGETKRDPLHSWCMYEHQIISDPLNRRQSAGGKGMRVNKGVVLALGFLCGACFFSMRLNEVQRKSIIPKPSKKESAEPDLN